MPDLSRLMLLSGGLWRMGMFSRKQAAADEGEIFAPSNTCLLYTSDAADE